MWNEKALPPFKKYSVPQLENLVMGLCFPGDDTDSSQLETAVAPVTLTSSVFGDQEKE